MTADSRVRRSLLTLLVSATVLTGCDRGPSTSARPVELATETTVPAVAPASTTTAAAPVRTTAPDGWKTCTSTARGYSIRYPGAWHTDTPARTECRYFDPEPVEYVPNSDGFLFALMVGSDNRPFEEALRPPSGGDSRPLVHEETTVGGRRAVRFEIEVTGDGRRSQLPRHTRLYGYLVERAGTAFGVTTYWFPDQPLAQYRAWKDTVDRAVATLRFL